MEEQNILAENYFKKMYDIDVSDKVEKKNGLTYLSWAWAWSEVKKLHPDAMYEVSKFGENYLPYVYDPNTGYMVYTTVSINEVTHEMWLPVLDGANMPMKAEPYTYKVGRGEKAFEKSVAAANMFDVNKAIMRCLTKNLAMHGLGLYIYAGEDLPESTQDEIEANKAANKAEADLLKKAIKAVIDAGTNVIKSGVDKNDMIAVVAKHNNGNGNPSSIKDIAVCESIMAEFANLKPVETKKKKETKEEK